MFAVLQTEETRRAGIFGRLLDRIKPLRAESRMAEGFGTRYQQITAVYRATGELDWEDILQAAGGNRTRMVLPRGLELPEGVPIQRYEPTLFLEQVLVHTAAQILDKCRLQPYRKVAGLIDWEGNYLSAAHRLVMHSSVLKVLTGSADRYETFARQMLELYGAPVVLCDRLESLEESVLILSPGSFCSREPVCLQGPVLAGGEQQLAGRCQVVDRFLLSYPPALGQDIPRGIAPIDLLGAFYEHNGIRELEQLLPAGGYCGTNLVTLSDIIAYVEEKMIKQTARS